MKKVYFFIFITMTLTLFSCNANYAIFKKVGRVWIIKQSIIKSKREKHQSFSIFDLMITATK